MAPQKIAVALVATAAARLRQSTTNFEANSLSPTSLHSSVPPTSPTSVAASTATLVTLKRSVGLSSATAIVVGALIGSGIFISPSTTLLNTGSVGLDLIIWALCGLLTLIGSLCYLELSSVVPASGGEYAYLQVAAAHLGGYWDAVPFLYAWCHLCLSDPLGMAVLSKTFVSYLLTLVCGHCDQDALLASMLAALFITLTTVLNLTNMRLVLRLQTVLSSLKVIILLTIVGIGVYRSIFGVNKLIGVHWFQGSKLGPRDFVSAIYGALWAYSGWKSITCLTEEVQNPHRNLPLSIIFGIGGVSVVYILTNLAYFVLLDPWRILSSNAVAVTFLDEAFHYKPATQIVPLMVGLSVFGCFCGGFISNGRIVLTAARSGHLWSPLAHVSVDSGLPVPAMLIRCVLGTSFLFLGTVEQLLELPIFLECTFEVLCIFALVLFRWTLPDARRVLRVPYAVMVLKLLLLGYIFYATVTSNKNLVQYLVLGSIVLVGCVAYVVFVRWQFRLPFEQHAATFLQKLLLTTYCDNSVLLGLATKQS